MTLLAAGIDPGAVTGIFLLDSEPGGHRAFQCDAATAPWLADELLRHFAGRGGQPAGIEEFRKGARHLAGQQPAITRDLIPVLEEITRGHGLRPVIRPAAMVKTWATDLRLERAGLNVPLKMTDARDAARHALFAAVHAGIVPDPLARDPLKTGRRRKDP